MKTVGVKARGARCDFLRVGNYQGYYWIYNNDGGIFGCRNTFPCSPLISGNYEEIRDIAILPGR